MLVVAITGGIGAGKSTAVDMFRYYNVPVIDTDIIARELVDSDPAILDTITTAFGDDILNKQQQLDRTRLRQVVFDDEQKRETLQNILHPRIHQRVIHDIETVNSGYCLVVIPLLVESQHQYPYDRVLLIDTDESTQLERASRRDSDSKALIQKIIAAQATREERRAASDDIIDNNGVLGDLQKQVDALHVKYINLAAA